MEKEQIINYINKHRPKIGKARLQGLSIHALTMIEVQVMLENKRMDKIKLN